MLQEEHNKCLVCFNKFTDEDTKIPIYVREKRHKNALKFATII